MPSSPSSRPYGEPSQLYGGEEEAGAPPPTGVYRCTKQAGATASADVSSKMVHVHDEGEELEIAETLQMPNGRWRGRGPEGWISFISERGHRLLELVARNRLELPTPGEWREFYESVGVREHAPIDTSTVARAVSELLPGFNRPPALAAAYKALELSHSSTIQRHELEMLFRHLLFFDERWETIEDLRHQFGERLGLAQCQDCCNALLADSRIEEQLATSFMHLSRGEADVSFDTMLTWMSRRAVGSLAPSPAQSPSGEAQSASKRARSPLGLRPAARTTPSWAMEAVPQTQLTPPRGPVRATVRLRGIVDRVRVRGQPGDFGSGFTPGTRLFSDSTCMASVVPEFLQSARLLLGLPMDEEEAVSHTLADYVTFGPSTDTPIQVYILFAQRDFVPAWLQRGFTKTGKVVQAAQRVNKRADAVKFTLDVWRSKRVYSRSAASGQSPTQLHPDPSQLSRADLVKLGASDLENIPLLDDRERHWDREVLASDEQAARKAGKLHNFVVLVLPEQQKEVRATAEHLTVVPSHRQGTKSPSARSRSPNPSGFGSNTGFRAKSPSERAVKEQALVATPPRAAAAGSTASMRANRSGSPKPRSKSPKPAFGSSSPMPHSVNPDGPNPQLVHGRAVSAGIARAKSPGKTLGPPRVAGLSPARVRPLDPPQAVAQAPAFGSGSRRNLSATSPSAGERSSQLVVTRRPAGSRSKSPMPGSRSKSPRPNSQSSRAKSPIPFAKATQDDEIIGAHVLARLPADGKWHDATVTQVLRFGKQLAVSFTDFGTTEVVARDEVLQPVSAKTKPKRSSPMPAKQPSVFEDPSLEDPLAGTQHIEITAETRKLVRRAFGAGSTVNLSDQQLGDEQFKAVADTLAEYTGVENLELRRNAVGSKGGALLGQLFQQGNHRQLTSINLASNSLGDVGASTLLAGIAKASCVETLDLAENHLGATAATALRDLIVANTALRTLGLRGNNLGGPGAWQLADSLIQDTSLTSLDLESNHLGDVGARALGLCLRHNTQLQTLVIVHNEIRDNGGEAIAAGLAHNSSLLTLEAAHNRFGEATANAMAITLREVNSTLQVLDLQHSAVDRSKALVAINDALRRNKGARRSSSPRSGPSLAPDASLHSWCGKVVERIVPAPGLTGGGSGDVRTVATEILLEEVLGLLRQRGSAPSLPVGAGQVASIADQPTHRNATSPRPVRSPSSSPAPIPSPHGSASEAASGSVRGRRASNATKGVQHSDPRAVMAFVEELYKGGLITKSVYDTRRAAILKDMQELTGIWEVDGRTSDDRPVRERIELVQLPNGELRGGPAPPLPGDNTTEPEVFTVHDGLVSGDRLSFLQRYPDEEETRWEASISRRSAPDGSSRPELVKGTW